MPYIAWLINSVGVWTMNIKAFVFLHIRTCTLIPKITLVQLPPQREHVHIESSLPCKYCNRCSQILVSVLLQRFLHVHLRPPIFCKRFSGGDPAAGKLHNLLFKPAGQVTFLGISLLAYLLFHFFTQPNAGINATKCQNFATHTPIFFFYWSTFVSIPTSSFPGSTTGPSSAWWAWTGSNGSPWCSGNTQTSSSCGQCGTLSGWSSPTWTSPNLATGTTSVLRWVLQTGSWVPPWMDWTWAGCPAKVWATCRQSLSCRSGSGRRPDERKNSSTDQWQTFKCLLPAKIPRNCPGIHVAILGTYFLGTLISGSLSATLGCLQKEVRRRFARRGKATLLLFP